MLDWFLHFRRATAAGDAERDAEVLIVGVVLVATGLLLR